MITALRSAALTFAIVLLAGKAAWAACNPAAADNVTATCTGATSNQNGSNGYGTGAEIGVTVTVVNNASVTGTADSIFLSDAVVTNSTGASLTGGNSGIYTNAGFAFVTNSGSITGTSAYGVRASTNAAVTNNVAASITGAQSGIVADSGVADVANFGSITGSTFHGIYANTRGTVTNSAGASITGGFYGIQVTNGVADIINSGTITGSTFHGIRAGTSATVTNNAGASLTGGDSGIYANTGSADVTNSGTITGNAFHGIRAGTSATVTNNAGASITGGDSGIYANAGSANVTNSGSIAGAAAYGVAGADATVTNNSSGSITGGNSGIYTNAGFADVTNSGSITGTSVYGVRAGTNVTVTNNVAASITGAQSGIVADSGVADVANFGSITGSTFHGIYANTSATVTNNAGASITGGIYGIEANAGGSSVFNAGTIAGGSAAIRFAGGGNTLTLAQGSVITGNVLGTGSDTFQLGGSGAATFDVSQLGSAAQYRGFATFDKIGSSIWTLTGTTTYAGPVNVNGGKLSVNGDITSASGVTVNAGGTLGGSGTVGNTTISAGGALAPGNAIGLLTVQGSLVFMAASSYMVEVSSTNADRINVTGTATLGGATVNTSFAAGSYVNKRYTILHADGAVNGTFAGPVTGLPLNFSSNLSYDSNNVYLDLTLYFVSPPNGGLNQNQQNVANAVVGFFNATGGIPLVFGGLTSNGLTQASGEAATGSQQATFNAMGMFMGMLADPSMTGRGEGVMALSGATPFAEENDAANAYAANGTRRSKSERDAYGAVYRKAPTVAETFAQRWSVWAAGYGSSQTTDGNATLGSNNVTSRVYGAAAGAVYRFSPFTVAGFALAGGGTNFSIANGLGSGRSDLFQAGAFIRHAVGPAHISAALAYGWQDITTDRTVTIAGIDQLRAKFNANAWSGRVEGGYRFVTQGVELTPYAAGQFTTFDLPAYAEGVVTGANTFALSYAGKSVAATRSELGVRSDKSFAMRDGIFTLRGRAAWAHDFNTDRNIAATFQTLNGASFVVNGAALGRESALTTASAEMKWLNGWSAAATFEGEFSNVTRSYAGKAAVRYAW